MADDAAENVRAKVGKLQRGWGHIADALGASRGWVEVVAHNVRESDADSFGRVLADRLGIGADFGISALRLERELLAYAEAVRELRRAIQAKEARRQGVVSE